MLDYIKGILKDKFVIPEYKECFDYAKKINVCQQNGVKYNNAYIEAHERLLKENPYYAKLNEAERLTEGVDAYLESEVE